ncbi:mannosidase alpha class 2A member 1 [Phyllostomus discolor]|uniref:Alpha-mannosidase n=3 Tax=Phyllostomus discolor TaxID=89673 RepID=A0A6J2LIV2_9CHIR|nr:alpha-mannosidase 2 [Phyllostomus discolor]KAF6125623.1 mannosidase alpha class 2A member 1 [Phyllostomus discolor]
MKLSRQFTVFGSAIFCVVIFSLYLMLDRGHLDYPKNPRREGSFPQGQLSMLQEKIDHLERLLAENNEIISNIRDSVINLSESVEDGSKSSLGNFSRGAGSPLLPSKQLSLKVDPEDCLFASQSGSQNSDVQMLDVYSLIPFDNPDGGVWKQGFDITYKSNEWDTKPLQVFVVPHSHNDPGWLKTFDEYFKEKTQYIFNNMVIKLKEDSRRKFIWSEISYLSKWWDTLDIQKKDAVKSLIENGQFEIVTGGWVMPDEAAAHYFAIIDQLIEGHQWLEKNLGVKPRSGWAIDPFGHSPTMAYLLNRAGFSHMLIQRVHYAVKKHFALHKTLEFFWRQNWDLGSVTDIFCHMMPFYSYDIPHTCGPDPKICCQFDFKRLPGGRFGCPWGVPPETIYLGNVQNRAEMLLDQYRKKSKLFRTAVVLAPLGDDFRYCERTEWDHQFKNYQLLFDYMNSQPRYNVKIQFGTLSDYFDALDKEDASSRKNSQSMFPVLSGDFFTYADRDDHYWSGYFTSRPFYKRMDRILESHLRSAEILYYFALQQAQKYKINGFLSSSYYAMLTEARRNIGLFQHHDAITGTAKDWVVVDYGTRLFHSLMNLKMIIGYSALLLLLKDKQSYESYTSVIVLEMESKQKSQSSLPQKNIIKLGAEPRYLVVYNPSEQERNSMVSLYVSSPAVQVSSASGKPVEIQMSAVWDTTSTISQMAYEISFLVQMPPLGLKVYTLLESTSSNPHLAEYVLYNGNIENKGIFNIKSIKSTEEDIILENSFIKLRFGQSGLMEEMISKEDGKRHEVRVQFSWYGTTSKKDKSGAYLFLPDGEAKPYVYTTHPLVRVQRGRFYSDVTCFFEHVTHSVRLYNIQGIEGQSVEVSNIVDIRKEHNREIAMRISSNINSQNRFYTDLNGYQIQPRMTMSKLPLQANVYPMTTMAYIQDAEHRLTLLSAQSLGVSSLKSGQIEVIMDRRLMQDDNRGLEQGVHDNKITANLFRILLEKRTVVNTEEDKKPVSYPSLLSHITSSFLNHPFLTMTEKIPVPTLQLLGEFSPLLSSLPCDIHLLNLRTIQSKVDGKYSDEAALILHRKGFDCRFSSRGTGLQCSTTQGKISIQKLFHKFTVVSLVPSSLSLMHSPPDARNMSEINLSPMEISTFRIQLR